MKSRHDLRYLNGGTISIMDNRKNMCTKSQYEKARLFWRTSFQYLMLVENISSEIVAQGNNWIVISDKELDESEYEDKTKWSDHSIMIPLLFNLYHGIELLVKGFLIAYDCKDSTHKIQKLCRQFAENYPNEKELITFLNKYTNDSCIPPILKDFLAANGLEFRDLYQALRYPFDQKFQEEKTYRNLMYKGKDGLQFFHELKYDIEAIRYAAVKLGGSLEPIER